MTSNVSAVSRDVYAGASNQHIGVKHAGFVNTSQHQTLGFCQALGDNLDCHRRRINKVEQVIKGQQIWMCLLLKTDRTEEKDRKRQRTDAYVMHADTLDT